MPIIFNHELPDKAAIFALFETTGWNADYRIDADQFMNAIEQSWYHILAYDDGRLVGFGRIVSDGLLHAVIFDVIVDPAYQGQGIGRRIMADLITICKKAKIRDIQLFCARGKVGFYEKCGFARRPEDGPGMEIKVIYKT
jgi:ribosomal protein S18 acetylase RimI-like enzyme